jgi:hypothetical protein
VANLGVVQNCTVREIKLPDSGTRKDLAAKNNVLWVLRTEVMMQIGMILVAVAFRSPRKRSPRS